MLTTPKIEQIARGVASHQVARGQLQRVLTESTTDSYGQEAVRITLVLTQTGADTLTGDQALDLLTEMQRSLLDKGEERFPIVEYATEHELQSDELPAEQEQDEDEA